MRRPSGDPPAHRPAAADRRGCRSGIPRRTAWAVAFLLLAYGLTVPADSGALTAGMSAAATNEHRGATLALHSTVGFGLSAAGA
jgi:hypothetical protein